MKILVVQQRFGIGDMVIFTPYIHAISEELKTPIVLMSKKSSKADQLFAYDKHISKILTLDKSNEGIWGFLKLVRQIKKEKFDKVFIFNGSLRYRMAMIFAGISSINQYPLFKSKDIIYETAKLFTENNLGKKINSQPKLILEKKDSKFINQKYNLDQNEKKIILGVSASGPTKRWDVKNFIKLINSLSKNRKCKFFLAGGIHDKNLIDEIFASNSKNNCFSLTDLDIKETLPIIKISDLYIGNDTSFMHISSALGIKSIGIFTDSPAYSYSSYSSLIIPVVPEGETLYSTTHNTHGKDKISFDRVLKIAESELI
jgi:heptosyltransferase-2